MSGQYFFMVKWDFLMKQGIIPQNIKSLDLTYKQMLSNEKAHKIIIDEINRSRSNTGNRFE